MRSALKRLARTPVLGRALLLPYRMAVALPVATRPLRQLARLLATSREHTNYTYPLTERNLKYLSAFVAEVCGVQRETAQRYVRELLDDAELRQHIQRGIRESPDGRFADVDVHYGRRAAWYAFTRIRKPATVVETGVDKGLGACVLTAALRRNAEEGARGHYFGTDINPDKGYLLSGAYASFGTILFGDSIASLRQFDRPIDLFINDSDHSLDYERAEYEAIATKLAPAALIVSDNAEVTAELLDFADRSGRRFLFFREEPEGHWSPGGGVGVAW